MKWKKKCLENSIIKCEKEVDALTEQTENKQDINLFIKYNDLSKTINEKRLDVENSDTNKGKSKIFKNNVGWFMLKYTV